MKVPCKNIPTFDCNTSTWSTTSFEDQFAFGAFLLEHCFKEPGQYQFHKSFSKQLWVEHALSFTKNGRYIHHAPNTEEYKQFWEQEKLKCRLGVLWKYEDRWYYTTRDYYFLLNYFRLVNKEVGYEESFTDARDGQYHMMLYEKLAEIFHQNSVILKRRQFMFSNCHIAKSLNYLYFENTKRIKWFAHDGKYIDNVNGSWFYLTLAKEFINKHTGWTKAFSPDNNGEIVQRVQVQRSPGKWEFIGNQSSIIANTMAKSPSAGVGGPTYMGWYEEGGIAPTADVTYGFIEPAIKSGTTRVGTFIIGGSVGDLKECAPLKKYMLNPEVNGFLGINTKWYSKQGTPRLCGLFIPAQYCMPEAMDEHGNSLVELALHILDKSEKEGWKAGEMKGSQMVVKDEPAWNKLEEKAYILMKSQNPRYIEEAFDTREIPIFHPLLCERRQEQLKLMEEKNLLYKRQGLFINMKFQEVKDIKYNPPSELQYPINPEQKDKRGLVNIYEEYDPRFEYFAGVDNIDSDTTVTSESVFSIHIYRKAYTEVDIISKKQKMIPGKLVACWAGRFDSIDETNDHGLALLLHYNAKACTERNRPNFINHCKRLNHRKVLVLAKDLPFDKDIDVYGKENGQFGVHRDSGKKVLGELQKTTKEILYGEKQVIYLDQIDKPQAEHSDDDDKQGIIKKIIRGYDYIDDYWTLEEIKKYNEHDNFDRVDSLMYCLHYANAEELSFANKLITVQTQSKISEEEPYIKSSKSRSLIGRRTNRRQNLLNY